MTEMNNARELNLQAHRAPASVWERRGWDGSREEIAITRLLLGIGGAALAFRAFAWVPGRDAPLPGSAEASPGLP